jgi:hypothetical protein
VYFTNRSMTFAAHCRARLGLDEARNDANQVASGGRMRRRWHALTEHCSHAAWHAACWQHRRNRGNA